MRTSNPAIKRALAVIAVAVAMFIADVTFNPHASEQNTAPRTTTPAQQPAKTDSGAGPTAAAGAHGYDPQRPLDW